MKSRLDAEAARTGRTQSQEAQWRLEKSFDRQQLLDEVLTLAYGPQSAALVAVLGHALGIIERNLNRDFPSQENSLDPPRGYTAAVAATAQIMEELNPLGDGFPPRKVRLAEMNSAQFFTLGVSCAASALHALRRDPDPHWQAVRTALGSLAEFESERKPK